MAGVIYSYIERDLRQWYKHPRWHIHHWKIHIHPLQKLIRAYFKKCDKCGKRLGMNGSVYGNWNGDKLWHEICMSENKKPAKGECCEQVEI